MNGYLLPPPLPPKPPNPPPSERPPGLPPPIDLPPAGGAPNARPEPTKPLEDEKAGAGWLKDLGAGATKPRLGAIVTGATPPLPAACPRSDGAGPKLLPAAPGATPPLPATCPRSDGAGSKLLLEKVRLGATGAMPPLPAARPRSDGAGSNPLPVTVAGAVFLEEETVPPLDRTPPAVPRDGAMPVPDGAMLPLFVKLPAMRPLLPATIFLALFLLNVLKGLAPALAVETLLDTGSRVTVELVVLLNTRFDTTLVVVAPETPGPPFTMTLSALIFTAPPELTTTVVVKSLRT